MVSLPRVQPSLRSSHHRQEYAIFFVPYALYVARSILRSFSERWWEVMRFCLLREVQAGASKKVGCVWHATHLCGVLTASVAGHNLERYRTAAAMGKGPKLCDLCTGYDPRGFHLNASYACFVIAYVDAGI